MKPIIAIAAAVGIYCASVIPAYAGIPVTVDYSIPAQINEIKNYAQAIQRLSQLRENWTQLRNQYEQQLKTYAGQFGNAALGNLLNDPALNNYLPENWQQDMQNLSTQGFAALPAQAQNVVKNLELKQCLGLSNSAQINCQARIGGVVVSQLNAFGAYNKAKQREKQIQSLKKAINGTQNPKEIAELNARIVAENGEIKNSATQLQLAQAAQAAQQQLLQAQAQAQDAKYWQSNVVGYGSNTQSQQLNTANWSL
jgi:type IV secretion system protein VirB5